MFLEYAILLVFPAVMAFAAAMDLFTMTIPNKVPLLLLAVFVCLAPFAGLGWVELASHVGVAFGALLLGMFCFARGWIGGGDAKLFAATALWFGHEHLLNYSMFAALIGGALTMLFLFGRNIPLPQMLARQTWIARLHDSKAGVPYGIALAAGALLVYPDTVWMSVFV